MCDRFPCGGVSELLLSQVPCVHVGRVEVVPIKIDVHHIQRS